MLPPWTSNKPEIYKQFHLKLISEYPLSKLFFTDVSKTEEEVAAAAVSTKLINKPFTCRLPDDSSIYIRQFYVYDAWYGRSVMPCVCMLMGCLKGP